MEKRFYKVSIKDIDQRTNRLVLGQIVGVARVMFEMTIIQHFKIFGLITEQNMTVETTESTYKAFCETIEKHFPGLCSFDEPVDEELYEIFKRRA